jgi:hypothetical protein
MSQLNISIDDVSPHPLSGIDVVDRCFDVLDVLPDVKFTLFVPTAYWRTVNIPGRVDTTTTSPLTLSEHMTFCDRLRSLPKSNFEVCYHGRYHGVPGVSNNDEMRHLSHDAFAELWYAMKDDVAAAGLSDVFVDVVRPPAMYMSPAAIECAQHVGVKCLALSPRKLHMACYAGADVTTNCHVVYANAWIPDDDLTNVAASGDDVVALYHACTWDRGYFNDDRVGDLITLIHAHDFEFRFIDDIGTQRG